jgi:hypothetical protein
VHSWAATWSSVCRSDGTSAVRAGEQLQDAVLYSVTVRGIRFERRNVCKYCRAHLETAWLGERKQAQVTQQAGSAVHRPGMGKPRLRLAGGSANQGPGAADC